MMALLAALLSASAYVSIPIGGDVPLTLQTLMVNLIALLLTPYPSFLTVFVYILLGLIGVPVFAGGTGGPAKLFGPTGGYIVAFLAAAPALSACSHCASLWMRKFCKSHAAADTIGYTFAAIGIGMPIIYAIGTIHLMIQLKISLSAALLMAVVPYIPLDLLKCIAAAFLAVQLRRIMERMQ